MKLSIYVILFIIGGSCGLEIYDFLTYEHKDFDDTTPARIEKWLENSLNDYKNDPKKIKETIKFKTEYTIKDSFRISVSLNDENAGDVSGRWEIIREDKKTLKINAKMIQKNMTHNGNCVLFRPFARGGRGRKEHPCEFTWKENSITMYLHLWLTPYLYIPVSAMKINVSISLPEVNLHRNRFQGMSKKEMQTWISREVQKEMKVEFERLFKHDPMRVFLHKMLSDIESEYPSNATIIT